MTNMLFFLNPWRAWWTDQVPLMHQATFPRLFAALFLGVCIGAERQWRQRAAGLRTNTLVCLGAAAFVDLGLTIAPNTTQVVAYVVSGVGFLGAGAIMKDGANVRGLNTAATLWCSAAVGACAGAGELLDAVFVAFLLIGINSALRPLSRYIDRKSLAAVATEVLYRLEVSCAPEHRQQVEEALTRSIAGKDLVLKELLYGEEGSLPGLLLAIVEAHSKESKPIQDVVGLLKGMRDVQAVTVTTKDADAE